jgi:hypothetical protein
MIGEVNCCLEANLQMTKFPSNLDDPRIIGGLFDEDILFFLGCKVGIWSFLLGNSKENIGEINWRFAETGTSGFGGRICRLVQKDREFVG